MIVKPSVNELLEHAENRFALIVATSKRARQIANGDEKLTDVDHKSAVTVASNEIAEGKVTICTPENKKENATEDEENVTEVEE